MFDLLAALDAQACALHELLATDAASVAVADLPELALRLHTVATRLDAAHHTAVGLVESCAALPAGPVTVNAWLGDSHHLDRTRAGRLRRNATWLAAHPQTAAAFAAAEITAAHVTAMRVVADATDTRRGAFADFEPLVLKAAAHTDARTVAQIMATWAETVDPDTSDDNADAAYNRRTVQLSEVGDGWDLRGWLPGVLGAELAGILNAFMEHTRRTHTNDTNTADAARAESSVPVSARRADALLDLARAAATHLPTTTRNRAQVAITIGINNTHTCPTCTTTGTTGATRQRVCRHLHLHSHRREHHRQRRDRTRFSRRHRRDSGRNSRGGYRWAVHRHHRHLGSRQRTRPRPPPTRPGPLGHLRRRDHPRRTRRALPPTRRRTHPTRRTGLPAPRARHPRPRLHHPRLRPPRRLVPSPPHRALGRRRGDLGRKRRLGRHSQHPNAAIARRSRTTKPHRARDAMPPHRRGAKGSRGHEARRS